MNASLQAQLARPAEPWDLCAVFDGFVVTFHGERVASAKTWDEARAAYNTLRAHSAMALESLNHALGVFAR
jgi:hypothetical protein